MEEVAPHRQAMDQSDSLDNLFTRWQRAATLRIQSQRTGRISDLDEAASIYRDIAAHALSNRGVVFHDRFEHTNRRKDLDEAVSMQRDALALRPEPHPDRSSSLDRLAAALHARFRLTDQQSDIDDAVDIHRDALRLRPPRHPERTSALSNLATALLTRFRRTGELDDLEKAISLTQTALSLRPETHPDQPSILNNLATMVYALFHVTYQDSDLVEVISLYKRVLSLQLDPHPDRSYSLINLAAALRTQYHQTDQRSHLDKAIDYCEQAIKELPSDHPRVCTASGTLGTVYMDRFDNTIKALRTGATIERDWEAEEDLIKSRDALRTAAHCETARVIDRLGFAKLWATLYPPDGSAMEAYRTAIRLLPRLATIDLDLESRQESLRVHTDGLAREAAAYAIQSQKSPRPLSFSKKAEAISGHWHFNCAHHWMNLNLKIKTSPRDSALSPVHSSRVLIEMSQGRRRNQ